MIPAGKDKYGITVYQGTEDDLKQYKLQSFLSKSRKCGDCRMCCKLYPVIEVEKYLSHNWCQHCNLGSGEKGCKIYDKRPILCQTYECAWKLGLLGDEDKPNKLGFLIDWSDKAAEHKSPITFMCNPERLEKVKNWIRKNWKKHSFLNRIGITGVFRISISENHNEDYMFFVEMEEQDVPKSQCFLRVSDSIKREKLLAKIMGKNIIEEKENVPDKVFI